MTLSPVFRSPGAIRLLEEEGIWRRLEPAIASQAEAVRTQYCELRQLLDGRFLEEPPKLPTEDSGGPDTLEFLQRFFFLILFRSLLESLGVSERRLQFYAELNFCIKGTITAADNLFDDQAKRLLPLGLGPGARYLSILQLMCFERLARRTVDRAAAGGILTADESDRVLRGLLDMMAEIGRLEGSEEEGVREIPPPASMVERVHRVRGGLLFALAFVAPKLLESGETAERLTAAEPALARLGTAFQIVDDLTDFEFDLQRRSHNLLVSEIRHNGTTRQRSALEELLAGSPGEPDVVQTLFREPARAVLGRAYVEARSAFAAFAELGFWFPPELADEVVHAIVGLDGVRRVAALSGDAAD